MISMFGGATRKAGVRVSDDAQVGSYSQPYGIFTRDGEPYPEQRMPFVRALQEQLLRR